MKRIIKLERVPVKQNVTCFPQRRSRRDDYRFYPPMWVRVPVGISESEISTPAGPRGSRGEGKRSGDESIHSRLLREMEHGSPVILRMIVGRGLWVSGPQANFHSQLVSGTYFRLACAKLETRCWDACRKIKKTRSHIDDFVRGHPGEGRYTSSTFDRPITKLEFFASCLLGAWRYPRQRRGH